MDVQAVFWALGDPWRYRIVEALRRSPRFVTELVDELGTSQPNVSRHLKVLRERGIIEGKREGKWIRYRIVPEALEAIARWAAEGSAARPSDPAGAGTPAAARTPVTDEPVRVEPPQRDDDVFPGY